MLKTKTNFTVHDLKDFTRANMAKYRATTRKCTFGFFIIICLLFLMKYNNSGINYNRLLDNILNIALMFDIVMVIALDLLFFMSRYLYYKKSCKVFKKKFNNAEVIFLLTFEENELIMELKNGNSNKIFNIPYNEIEIIYESKYFYGLFTVDKKKLIPIDKRKLSRTMQNELLDFCKSKKIEIVLENGKNK